MGMRGPKPDIESNPQFLMSSQVEPEADLSPEELAVFNRLTAQVTDAKRSESASFNLLARMLVELEGARAALKVFHPATDPSEWLAARRCLTSLELATGGVLRSLGMTPTTRGKR